jgi:hypothetical protein
VINPQIRFEIAVGSYKPRNATTGIPFDYAHEKFSHHGEDCTFETLLPRFGIEDKALRKISEMVHDADLEDEKFQRPECLGLDRILKGWAKRGMADEEILIQGAACFDGLYAFLRKL